MIKSRLTVNGWLQIVVLSEKATSDIASFQARVSKSQVDDLVSCLESTLERIELIETTYADDDTAKDLYENGAVIKVGAFVTITYPSICKVHLIYRSATIYLSIHDLKPLVSSLKAL